MRNFVIATGLVTNHASIISYCPGPALAPQDLSFRAYGLSVSMVVWRNRDGLSFVSLLSHALGSMICVEQGPLLLYQVFTTVHTAICEL